MKLILVLLGLALSGAILIVLDHRMHARPAMARRQSWMKYGVYLGYLGVMVGVRWWGWLPALVAIGVVGLAASIEVIRLLRAHPLRALGVAVIVLFGLSHLLRLEPLLWSDVFLLVAVADSYAQLIGRLIGRRPLCPQISPGKTLEGFVAGVLAASALSVVTSYLWTGRDVGIALLLGALVAVAATLGDLFFSLIKRKCQVKDFSRAIPGHGGVLDRIDSLVFAAPAFYGLVYMVSDV